MTFFQAIILGVLQGVTELFPVSSLGHSVILPAFLGWDDVVAAQQAAESYFLAFLVGLHVATALALAFYFREDWKRIIGAILGSISRRRIEGPDARLGWLLIVATIPAGLLGIIFEHEFRVVFATPFLAGILLFINGLILLLGERLRRRSASPHSRPIRLGPAARDISRDRYRELDTLEFREAGAIGVAQVFALLAGISRSGITMVAGLVRGLDHEDAARFSFLLATPIIGAAALLKLPDLFGTSGNGIRGPALAASLCAAVTAFFSVRFLVKYFETKTLTPFAIYCVVAGAASLAYLSATQ
jgi:undecaprenyl-diphosphatase